MNSNRTSLLEALYLAIGELAVSAAVALVYLAIGKFDITVLLGVALGSAVTVLNFLFLIVVLNKETDSFISARGDKEMDEEEAAKFAKEHGARIQSVSKLSFVIRSISMLICLILAFALTEVFDVLATLIPLLCMRPILYVRELFRKKGV